MIPWVGKNKVVKLVTMHESHRSARINSSVLFLYSRAKNRQYDVGLRFYKTDCVPLMTKKWPGNIHANTRLGYGMEEIISGITRNDRELYKKIFWEDFIGESRRLMGLRMVRVKLGPGGDRSGYATNVPWWKQARLLLPFHMQKWDYFFYSEFWIWYPRDFSDFNVNEYPQIALITLTVLPFFLLPHSSLNISPDISTYLVFWFHSRIKISAFSMKQN